MLAKALGIWGIGSGSDEGKITFESKARGAKKVVQTLVSTMKEHGSSAEMLRSAIVIISHWLRR